jgi:uncharacterized membrane protein
MMRSSAWLAMGRPSCGRSTAPTAVICVGYLAAILARLTVEQLSPAHRYEDGVPPVITMAPTFHGLLAEAVDQIRSNAVGYVTIMALMLGAFDALASLTVSPARRLALEDQLRWIGDLADRSLDSRHDRSGIDRHLMHVGLALKVEPLPRPTQGKA